MRRVFRIVLGLALIGYGIYSGNGWFFLGVIPLVFGIINWCPMEKLFGAKCEGDSCCSGGSCEAPKTEVLKPQESASSCCGEVKQWSTEPKESCCGGDKKESSGDSCCSNDKSEPCCANENCIKIEVLGTGCQKCKTLEALVKEAASPYGDKYCVVKVEDIEKIMSYGITSTPGLVIDGKVVLSGRLPSAEEIKAFLS